ncbi:MAG: uroporphyrinogen-III C-methyltransferase [Gammaproteobacteria bacterium]
MTNNDSNIKTTDKIENNDVVLNEDKQDTGDGNAPKVITIILLFGLIAGAYYLWDELNKTKTAFESASVVASVNFDASKKEIMDLKASIQQLLDSQESITDALEILYQRQPANNEEWALVEIEYLLIIATHRLLLEKDIATALAAIEAADLRLKDLGNPRLIPVREQLATDINKLRSISPVDISGLALYLADLINRSDTLQLKGNVISKEQKDKNALQSINEDISWRDLPTILWQELKGLVVIKRSGETRQALLLADEEYFLYQNLRLELENARLSVLRRDTENLRTSINILRTWLDQYFNTNDAAVANVLETLEKMASVVLDPELPDINSSLESLRAYIRSAGPTGNSTDEVTEVPAS